MDLVTLKVYDSGIQAHILKNTLEYNGVYVFIKNLFSMTIYPLRNAVGGFRVQVPKEQFKKAQNIILKIEKGDFDLYKHISLN